MTKKYRSKVLAMYFISSTELTPTIDINPTSLLPYTFGYTLQQCRVYVNCRGQFCRAYEVPIFIMIEHSTAREFIKMVLTFPTLSEVMNMTSSEDHNSFDKMGSVDRPYYDTEIYIPPNTFTFTPIEISALTVINSLP